MDVIEKLAREYEFIAFLIMAWKALWAILVLLFLILVGYELNRTRRCRRIFESEHITKTALRNSKEGASEFVALLQRRKFMAEKMYSNWSRPTEERYLNTLLEEGSTESLARFIRECHARGCEISLRPASSDTDRVEVSDTKMVIRRQIANVDNLSIYEYVKLRNIEEFTGHKR